MVLREALRRTKKVGLGQLAMRGREYMVSLKPCGRGIVLETLRYADEVHKAQGYFRDIADAKPDEELLELAETLIEKKTAKFDPAQIPRPLCRGAGGADRAEAQGQDHPHRGGRRKRRAAASNVVDLMAALKKIDRADRAKARRRPRARREERQPARRRQRQRRQKKRGARAQAGSGMRQPSWRLNSQRRRMARRLPSLETYNQKRDFSKTAEPPARPRMPAMATASWCRSMMRPGSITTAAGAGRHAQELGGAERAEPRPGRQAAGVRTEDHPLSYATFEGTIPKGEYGGGTVMLWDRGTWTPDPRKDPRKTLEEGHLHFTLDGERMKGEWIMIRLKPRGREKKRELDPARRSTTTMPAVPTGLTDRYLTSASRPGGRCRRSRAARKP